MTRLTRLSAAAQAHYVVLRSVPEISLIPFDKNIEKLFQIFSDGSRAYNTDISAFAVFTDQIHLLLTPREKAEDLSRFVQQLSRLYSHYFNDEFSRNGKIWQGRFESSSTGKRQTFGGDDLYGVAAVCIRLRRAAVLSVEQLLPSRRHPQRLLHGAFQ